MDQFPVEEVSISSKWGIVDMLSYQRKIKPKNKYEVIWRCYEIKSSKQDFYSKSKWTFVGHYNYFVMPEEVFDIVQNDIPEGVGVYLPIGWHGHLECVVHAKRQDLKVTDEELTRRFIGSQNREILKAKEILWREEVANDR